MLNGTFRRWQRYIFSPRRGVRWGKLKSLGPSGSTRRKNWILDNGTEAFYKRDPLHRIVSAAAHYERIEPTGSSTWGSNRGLSSGAFRRRAGLLIRSVLPLSRFGMLESVEDILGCIDPRDSVRATGCRLLVIESDFAHRFSQAETRILVHHGPSRLVLYHRYLRYETA